MRYEGNGVSVHVGGCVQCVLRVYRFLVALFATGFVALFSK